MAGTSRARHAIYDIPWLRSKRVSAVVPRSVSKAIFKMGITSSLFHCSRNRLISFNDKSHQERKQKSPGFLRRLRPASRLIEFKKVDRLMHSSPLRHGLFIITGPLRARRNASSWLNSSSVRSPWPSSWLFDWR